MKDLARELGVSIATVSRALRNSPEIGVEMQRRVKELAKKLNYRPNPFAQSLRKEAPKVIGVVVPNLVTHYYAAVLDGIEAEARKSGYSIISTNSHESFEDEAQAIDNFISLHVEGIIACLAQSTTDYSHFEEIANMGIPLVFFGRTCLTDKFSSVTANGDEAAQMATQHLIDTGSRRIAFIGGPNHLDMVKKNIKADYALKKKIVLDIEKNHVTLRAASLKYGACSQRISVWLRQYRTGGLAALNSTKRRGRSPGMGRPKKNSKPLTELERLRKEVQKLKTENALLKKVRALVEERNARLREIGQGPSKN